MTEISDQNLLLGQLDWFRAMGVDAALDEAPVDWLARGTVAPGSGFAWPDREAKVQDARRSPVQQTSEAVTIAPHVPAASPPPARTIFEANFVTRSRPQTPLAASGAETEARKIARTATSLETLEAALRGFDGCTLKATATKLCFYRGSPNARLMVIGEAPGRDEDLEGRPFVGRAGQLLDKMLAAIGLTEADVHITNVVYWRPPGNRTPTPQETLACRPFLERQIELVKPELIVALGGSAAKEVLGITDGIMRLRGKWREATFGTAHVHAIATLHPAYLLRTPAAKQLAWLDLLQIKARLAS